jgi:hypothetical protein
MKDSTEQRGALDEEDRAARTFLFEVSVRIYSVHPEPDELFPVLYTRMLPFNRLCTGEETPCGGKMAEARDGTGRKTEDRLVNSPHGPGADRGVALSGRQVADLTKISKVGEVGNNDASVLGKGVSSGSVQFCIEKTVSCEEEIELTFELNVELCTQLSDELIQHWIARQRDDHGLVRDGPIGQRSASSGYLRCNL